MTAKNDEIINMAREQGLPETEIEGVFRVNADDLCRVADAILAARKQDDALIMQLAEALERARTTILGDRQRLTAEDVLAMFDATCAARERMEARYD